MMYKQETPCLSQPVNKIVTFIHHGNKHEIGPYGAEEHEGNFESDFILYFPFIFHLNRTNN